MTSMPSLCLANPLVESTTTAMAHGFKFGYRFEGTGPNALRGVRSILAIRDLPGEFHGDKMTPETHVQVQILFLGSPSWLTVPANTIVRL